VNRLKGGSAQCRSVSAYVAMERMDVIYSALGTLGGELHTTERKAEDVRLVGELSAIERF
jgi:hypothetical protein